MALRRSIIIANQLSFSEYTATGNPLTFSTNVAKPLKSLSIPWTPSQSGSGDPSPENVRPISGFDGVTVWQSGTNVWDEEWVNEKKDISSETGELIDDINSYYFRSKNYIPIVPGTKYFDHNEVLQSGNYRLFFYDENKDYISFVSHPNNTSFTVPNNAHYMLFRFVSSEGATYQNNISMNYPYTDTSYHAYTGATYPVSFPALGVNQFNGVWEHGNIAAGRNEPSTTAMRTGFIDVDPSTAYYAYTTRTGKVYLFEYDENGTYLNIVTNISNGKSFTTSAATKKIRIADRNSGTETVNTGINYPSTVTAYEPYTNTCYGGELDLVSGVLTVKWNMIMLDGTEDYLQFNNTAKQLRIQNFGEHFPETAGSDLRCDFFKPLSADPFGVYVAFSAHNQLRFCFPSTYDKTSALSFLQENNTHVAYRLNEPKTYQLTPQQITALLGDNVIWSDTNGSNTAVYLKKG